MFLEAVQAAGQCPLLVIVVALTLAYFYMSQRSAFKNIPPMPEKPYPILGHLSKMKKDQRGTIKKWAAQTGDIYSFYMGHQLAIVLSGYDIINEALVKHGDVFSDRPRVFIQRAFPDADQGILLSSGETWKEQRVVALSILKSFGMGKNSLAEKIQVEVDYYMTALGELKGEPANVRALTNNCVSNVICNIMVGRRFDHHDEMFQHMIHLMNEQVALSGQAGILNVFPFLRFLPGDVFKAKKMVQNHGEMIHFLQTQFVDPFVNSSEQNHCECFVKEYLREMKQNHKEGKPTTMDLVNLRRSIYHLFIAGTETTSTTILWFILFMLHNPGVFGKIQSELDEVVSKERPPTVQDKANLNYLNACIKETQRLGSIVPFSIVHKCSQTTTLRGYTIPKGSFIFPNLDSVLLSEETWKDPLSFQPERFLDEDGNVTSPKEFIPFSVGRRFCLGDSLAKMELFLFIGSLSQRFDILPVDKETLPPLKGVAGITSPPLPYEVRLVQRQR